MTDKDILNNMEFEIQKKINSPEWDLRIASKVTSRIKRKKRIKKALPLSASAAAVMIFAFFLNSGGNTPDDYEQLILTQIDGIYSEVFTEKYTAAVSEDDEIYDNIDMLIDSTLSKR